MELTGSFTGFLMSAQGCVPGKQHICPQGPQMHSHTTPTSGVTLPSNNVLNLESRQNNGFLKYKLNSNRKGSWFCLHAHRHNCENG